MSDYNDADTRDCTPRRHHIAAGEFWAWLTSRKNWKAIRNAGNSSLVAVASRERERARQFIEECQADVPLTPQPAACGGYRELLDRDDIDAVYVPLRLCNDSTERSKLGKQSS